jgi:hypothetical protein
LDVIKGCLTLQRNTNFDDGTPQKFKDLHYIPDNSNYLQRILLIMERFLFALVKVCGKFKLKSPSYSSYNDDYNFKLFFDSIFKLNKSLNRKYFPFIRIYFGVADLPFILKDLSLDNISDVDKVSAELFPKLPGILEKNLLCITMISHSQAFGLTYISKHIDFLHLLTTSPKLNQNIFKELLFGIYSFLIYGGPPNEVKKLLNSNFMFDIRSIINTLRNNSDSEKNNEIEITSQYVISSFVTIKLLSMIFLTLNESKYNSSSNNYSDIIIGFSFKNEYL